MTNCCISLSAAFLASTIALASTTTQADEWRFGIGTGLFALNMEGDLGIGTTAGPVETDFDLDFDDIMDLQETGAGLVLFAGKDKLSFRLSVSELELEARENGNVGATPVSYRVNYTKSAGDFSVTYLFNNSEKNRWSAQAGVRYYEHDWEMAVTSGPAGAGADLDESWTDVYVGINHIYVIDKALSWNTTVNVGSGDSDLSYLINTGLNWRFADH